MPPQERPQQPLSVEELVARARGKQKEQQDRWDREKEEKNKAREVRLAQIQREAEEARESRRLKNLSMSHIKPFDPEKNKLTGKDYASGEKGEEN